MSGKIRTTKSFPNSKRVRTMLAEALSVHGFVRPDNRIDVQGFVRFIDGEVSDTTVRRILSGDIKHIQVATMTILADSLALNLTELREASEKTYDFYRPRKNVTSDPSSGEEYVVVEIDGETEEQPMAKDTRKDLAPTEGATLTIELGREAKLLAKFAPKEFQAIANRIQALAAEEFGKAVEDLL